MNNYHSQLQTLHEAMVRDKRQPMLELVKPARGNVFTPEARVAVYTDGYTQRLIDAALSDYPALASHMGSDACRAAMINFVKTTPSRCWDMNHYPPAFADFLKAHSPDQAAHALADLESSIMQVFWAPSVRSLSAVTLANMGEEALGDSVLRLIPACRLLALEYNANAYLNVMRANGSALPMQKEAEHLLIIRFDNEVHRLVLDAEEYSLLASLQAGATFNDALSAQPHPEALASQLPGYLQRWLKYGIFAA